MLSVATLTTHGITSSTTLTMASRRMSVSASVGRSANTAKKPAMVRRASRGQIVWGLCIFILRAVGDRNSSPAAPPMPHFAKSRRKKQIPRAGTPASRVRERILAPEKRERGHRGGASAPPRGGNGGSIWFNLVQLGSDFGGSRLSGAAAGPYSGPTPRTWRMRHYLHARQ